MTAPATHHDDALRARLAGMAREEGYGVHARTLLEAAERLGAMGKALDAAIGALRSYQHGNASPDLAQEVADFCEGIVHGTGADAAP